MKLARFVVLLSVACGWHLAAQVPTFDNSGNGLLKGTYYFREVFYLVGDGSGDLSRALALYGNVTFSGAGAYTMAASVYDSNNGLQTGSLSGTYSISASGYGFISNPLSSGDFIFGLVSAQGIFIGSSTESGFNDIFIAAPLASPVPTAASFKGSYWISDTDLSSGSPLGALSALFQFNPDGVGSLGNVAISGYIGQAGTTVTNYTATAVKYSFQNGAGVVTFPNSTSALAIVVGQKFLYISPDGNFVFGGSPTSWDMFVGVRVASSAPNLSGLYYQAGIDEDDSQLANGFGNLDTYFGAFNAGGGAIVGHQRLADVFNTSSLDYTYSDGYAVKSDGTYSTPGMRYVVGAGGIRIGSGIGPFLGLNVALPAPSLSGSGVFLNPQGVVNAASSAPFTAGIAPGELLTLYGTGLSNDTQIASSVPFPSTLDGVQVMINGVAAPIYYVTPGAVSAYVPYSATTAVIQIQVINNGSPSNIVTNFMSSTAPGIFTEPEGGLGAGAVLHPDYTKVTTDNPAQVGETVAVYLTGLGAVFPAVPDGAAAPTSPFSLTTNTITAYVGGIQAAIGYAGLAPGLAGLYQVNLTIPTGVTAGNNALDISGPDSYTSEAFIPIAAATTAAVAPAPQSVVSRMRVPSVSGKPVVRPKSAAPSDHRRQ